MSGVLQGEHLSPLLVFLFINGVNHVLRDCKFLYFTNDIKILIQIKSYNDCIMFQHNLNRFVEWFNHIGISLNIEKYNYMIYTRSTMTFFNSYNYNGFNLSNVNDSVLDFSYKFSRCLSPSLHVKMIRFRN